ncbi:hypothetical protein ARMGADRAFT_1067128 [Armillaria gallica]|uniref:Uncharacterized protein n=1 Tax=Armillaria gallica TaxID=47427 RepID=A0A2H3CPG7_ARMGA|nr:hypothetical protein ARMGADRAFT_1067128 [Armillaria gallica]
MTLWLKDFTFNMSKRIELASAVGKTGYKYGCLDVSPDVGYKEKHRQGQMNSHAIFPTFPNTSFCQSMIANSGT